MTVSLSISKLARFICPPGSSKRIMALLRAYCDASFTDRLPQSGWTAVAGYVGTDEMWASAERQWLENKKLWGLAEFSVSEIIAGKVLGIGNTKAELCVGSFGKIIRDSKLEGVSAAIKDADFDQAYKSDRFPTKYHMCISMLIHIIDEHVKLHFVGDQVAIVLDPDGNEDDAIRALCDEWKKEAPIIASIAFARRSQYPAIECADLCAGSERFAQNAGGRTQVFHDNKWFSTTHAHNHRAIFWSFEDEKRVEAALQERERRRRERQREG